MQNTILEYNVILKDMSLQKTFLARYAQQLEDEAKNGIGIERYTKPEFDYDRSQVRMIPTVEQPVGLVERMNPSDDYKSAVELFNAYKDISLLQAKDYSFWTYLAHVDLFPYVQAKNKELLQPGFNDATYITNHFFRGFGGLIYHPLAGLWWDVYCTYDSSLEDPYKYTKYIFRDYGLRVTYIGRYRIFRNKPELIGFLDFMMANDSLFKEHARQRYRWAAQYLNRVGGSRNFTNMTSRQVFQLLERVKDKIASVNCDDDVMTVL